MNHRVSSAPVIVVRGAGEMASGVAQRLFRVGFKLVLTEIAAPLAIRRGVAFAEAVYSGSQKVEGIEARCVESIEAALQELKSNRVPILVDSHLTVCAPLLAQERAIVVDARMLKTRASHEYPSNVVIIGLGPGFAAPDNARFVIETNRGHNLGRVFNEGSAEENTQTPAEVLGASRGRVVYASTCGIFCADKNIGDPVNAGDIIGRVDDFRVTVGLSGVLRGILHDGVRLTSRIKVADIDPRADRATCFLISDKARAIAGGVLEAVLIALNFSR
jgi:xanthine dehydrogenase accessory factor